MKRRTHLVHQFVEYIPQEPQDGMVYVSIPFATVVHKCCCGCGNEVVTPLSPTDWQLTFDGETISLEPSIGNWSFACRSHYWVRRNEVSWAPRWSERQIQAGRANDRHAKERYFEGRRMASPAAQPERQSKSRWLASVWQRLKRQGS